MENEFEDYCNICNEQLTKDYQQVYLIWKTHKPNDRYDLEKVCPNYKECIEKVHNGEKEGDWIPYLGEWDVWFDRPRYKISIMDPDYIPAWSDDCICRRDCHSGECYEKIKKGDNGRCKCSSD